jgi:predicted transcriptional regulator
MELPYHLKALPPEALDVLRYFGSIDMPIAHAEDITEGVGLTDRTFGKVIRRLVTKGYLQMDGDQAYRLSDQGHKAVEELTEYEASGPAVKTRREVATQAIPRHLVVVTPGAFVADKAAQVHVGFLASDGDELDEPADVVARVSVINGEPTRPQEVAFQLENEEDHKALTVTPGRYKCLRIRVNLFQLGPNPDDIAVVGGLYVDVDVLPQADARATQWSAYGADITLTKILD